MGFNNSTYSRNRIGSAPPPATLDTTDLKRLPFRPYVPMPSVIVHREGSLDYRNIPSLAERAK